ncbi:Mercuric reductase [Fundidesulfovibrio magnetotacticus]|uniref:Mercuric reductase n=1 Tax=Fundidesulfovibrio magnetotacticus TaxID=2730080 RepID=A0A6V8LUR8_9BACT|nr:FAD-dependent oxidoreductase [Fundidesulfovibrio magnetotacticus]GFK95484.1 Mercuric reductase [Fundidesulfovibrio magnetotacticus]
MTSHDFDLGVIGGGAAGLTAAAGAARLGAKVLLVEKEPVLGGDCLHYGCVPSKTLIATAKLRRRMHDAARWGLPNPELPPVDYSKVAARIREVVARIQRHDSFERFCSLGVLVETGQAEFSDEHSVRLNGRTVSASRWIVATGSSPAVPDIPGLRQTQHLTNRELFSLEELPESLVVLGGGAVAVEMAQAFARLGSRVTLVQRSAHLLTGEDPDLADLVRARLEAEGVTVLTGTRARFVSPGYGLRHVGYVTESGEEGVASGKALLVALGRRPNVDGLRLENAGVAYTDKGIPTDQRLRTTAPTVWAAGDVLGKWLYTHAAGYEGGVALANAVARLPRKADYTFMPRVTYCEPELAGVGHGEASAARAGLEVDVVTERFEDNDRAQADGTPEGVLKLLVDRKGKVAGVRALGPRAGDVVCEWVTALSGGVKLSKVAQATHPYPTLGEINRRAAADYLAPKLFDGLAPKLLKAVFGLKGRACG